MDDYLSKPLSLDRLKQTLLAHLNQAHDDTVRSKTHIPGLSVSNAPVGPAPAPANGPLNADALDCIRELQQPGEPNLLEQVIGLYLETSKELWSKLRVAVDTGDAAAVGEAAHALKSSSANVGAKSLAELCRQLETMGRQNDLSCASSLLDKLSVEYQLAVHLKCEIEILAE